MLSTACMSLRNTHTLHFHGFRSHQAVSLVASYSLFFLAMDGRHSVSPRVLFLQMRRVPHRFDPTYPFCPAMEYNGVAMQQTLEQLFLELLALPLVEIPPPLDFARVVACLSYCMRHRCHDLHTVALKQPFHDPPIDF
mmetsp:Transcript_19556/g.35478  ORF Transcript_19556/g.35478 Transcript_19556/m.35478 type:complete len:138 (-) Transcript_19556:690-1103(-)